MDEKLKNKKVSAISLGCDKNRVDLERMLFKLKDYGFEIIDDESQANIILVNTCAFISPAKEESLENIFGALARKSNGNLEKVIVAGCLSQRHKDELEKEISEVDAFLLAEENEEICDIVEKLYDVPVSKKKYKEGRVFTTRGHYAYLKIAEGCSNACSYCTIPRIKGRYQSYDMDELVSETKYLADNGVKEIILVAQDVTRYGEDLYGKNCLIDLCKRIAKIDKVEWIRIHYAYPEKVSDELLTFVVQEKKMCKYLDIPLQHIDNDVLAGMKRKMGEEETRALIDTIKTKYYDQIALRTTFIVGFPGETSAAFRKLCKFVKETKFDYAGFFPYFREEFTPSFYMKNQVPKFFKKLRHKKITRLQRKVVLQKAKSAMGKVMKVLIDYFDETTGLFVGHSEFLSPMVDFGVEIVDNGNITAGQFVDVLISDFDGQNYKGVCYELGK